ncbi:MAG: hypothetical protein HY300_20240 [Verrucomicrobia bacterium]|nr:hypothetical protein [Verrucomicrobiota bacterium]
MADLKSLSLNQSENRKWCLWSLWIGIPVTVVFIIVGKAPASYLIWSGIIGLTFIPFVALSIRFPNRMWNLPIVFQFIFAHQGLNDHFHVSLFSARLADASVTFVVLNILLLLLWKPLEKFAAKNKPTEKPNPPTATPNP